MKKKIIAGVLAIACSLSLMGCDANVSDKFKGLIGDKSSSPISVTIVNHPVEAKQDGKVLATGNYAEVILSEDSADSTRSVPRNVVCESSSPCAYRNTFP